MNLGTSNLRQKEKGKGKINADFWQYNEIKMEKYKITAIKFKGIEDYDHSSFRKI